MKLKEFNEENCISQRNSIASMGVNLKSGLFSLNKTACELIGLDNNDRLAFHQDQEDPENWYIEKVKTKGFMVRKKSGITTGVLFNNSQLSKQIADSCGNTDKSIRILLAGKPTDFEKRKLWGLLISGSVGTKKSGK